VACDVFAPDVTFVARTAARKFLPNPNVMAEYGYALGQKKHGAMMPVMNTVFGPPDKLPFDMGHLRHPITYNAGVKADEAERRSAREGLEKDLEAALRLTIKSLPPPAPPPPLISAAAVEQADALYMERLNYIPAGIGSPVVLRHAPRLILHVMPVSMFGDGPTIDHAAPKLLGLHFRPAGYEKIDGRPRMEGWVWYQPPQPQPGLPNPVSSWWSRLDWNGFVEIALALESPDVEGQPSFIRGYALERYIVRTLDEVAEAYAALKFESPVIIRATLFGVAEAKLIKSTAGYSAGFDRPAIGPAAVQLAQMAKPLGTSLRPILDSIWHAAGWPDGSPSFGGGDWEGYANAYPYK
jgi:hypothetical protein